MPDARNDTAETREESTVTPAASPSRSMFRDPIVVRMMYVAVGIVLIFLVTVLGVLASGITKQSGPRTLAEQEAVISGEEVRQGSTNPAVWGQYIAALIASGQEGRAKNMIAKGRESIDDSATAEFTLAEVRLMAANEDFEGVVKAADDGMKQIQEAHDAALAKGGLAAQTANLEGLHMNYYILALLKADAYRELGDWAKAIEQFDLYIDRNPGAADILIDRGNAKIEVGDTDGAEADFRKALEFTPENPEALAGLEKIGVANDE